MLRCWFLLSWNVIFFSWLPPERLSFDQRNPCLRITLNEHMCMFESHLFCCTCVPWQKFCFIIFWRYWIFQLKKKKLTSINWLKHSILECFVEKLIPVSHFVIFFIIRGKGALNGPYIIRSEVLPPPIRHKYLKARKLKLEAFCSYHLFMLVAYGSFACCFPQNPHTYENV